MPADRQALRWRLAALAGARAGYFTAAHARQVGYSYQAQKFHVDRGNWRRIDRGLFRLPEWPVGAHDPLVRWSLWARGRAVVSHDTALAVHHLGDAPPAPVHLTVPPNFRPRAAEVVLHRSDLPESDVRPLEGFRVTSPVRTLLDVTASTPDPGQLAGAVAAACRQDPTVEPALFARAGAGEFGPRAAQRIDHALRAGSRL